LANWIKKEDPTICCLQETHLIDRTSTGLGWKAGRRFTHQWPLKMAGVAILISDKVDFKLTLIRLDKEGHSILIKGEIHQKEITIINLYAPNIIASNFIKHTLMDLKAYKDSNTVVMGDFNTPYHQLIGHPNEKSTKKF
jgi:exonuclease III